MTYRLMALIVGLALFAGCGNGDTHRGQSATAVLNPTEGNEVSGRVAFARTDKGILVIAEVHGLTPGKHGFHIHEYGDCSAPDASSAGGHYNPTKQPHGSPEDENHHVGDLGNLVADENGDAYYEQYNTILTLDGDESIIGKSVIVHADADDLVSQPTGNAGGRVACGVIEWNE